MSEWSIGYPTALFGGFVSFLSPCVLPLVPGYLSFIAGTTARDASEAAASMRHRLVTALAFVFGFSVVFVAMGAGATAIGRLLLYYRNEANLVGGALVIVFGVFVTGLIRPRWLMGDYRPVGWVRSGGGPTGAGVLGVAFGVGWTPCIGPILGGILTVAAARGGDLSGTALMSTYAAGLGIPFVLAALFTDRFARSLARLRGIGRWLHPAAGVLMIVVGVAMMTGQMTTFAYWLLEMFPVLGRIG